jgi:hypothetical protein
VERCAVVEEAAENVTQQNATPELIAEPRKTGSPHSDNTETSQKAQGVQKDLRSRGPSSSSQTQSKCTSPKDIFPLIKIYTG